MLRGRFTPHRLKEGEAYHIVTLSQSASLVEKSLP